MVRMLYIVCGLVWAWSAGMALAVDDSPTEKDKESILKIFKDHIKPVLLKNAEAWKKGHETSYTQYVELLDAVPQWYESKFQSERIIADLQDLARTLKKKEEYSYYGKEESIRKGKVYKIISVYLTGRYTPMDGGVTLIVVFEPETSEVLFVYRGVQG